MKLVWVNSSMLVQMHPHCIFGLNEHHFSESMWNENTNIENFSRWISKLWMEKALMFSHSSAPSCKVYVSKWYHLQVLPACGLPAPAQIFLWLLTAVWARRRILQENQFPPAGFLGGTCSVDTLCKQWSEEKFLLILSVLQEKLMPVICSVPSSMMWFCAFLHKSSHPSSTRRSAEATGMGMVPAGRLWLWPC